MEFYVFLNIWVELKCVVYLEHAENLLLQRCSHLQEGRPLSLEGKEGSITDLQPDSCLMLRTELTSDCF